nr:MAG TPA: hypothetical protein [Caudoviricetes sp.]
MIKVVRRSALTTSIPFFIISGLTTANGFEPPAALLRNTLFPIAFREIFWKI